MFPKRLIFALSCLMGLPCVLLSCVEATDSNPCLTFVDQTIQSYALTSWDTDHNACISQAEADAVVEIPKEAFLGNEDIKTLEDLNQFPNLTIIRDSAFKDCPMLTQVNLEHVITIDDYAFSHCPITSIDLPNVKTIKAYVFNQDNLTSVHLPSIVDVAFDFFNHIHNDGWCIDYTLNSNTYFWTCASGQKCVRTPSDDDPIQNPYTYNKYIYTCQ